MKILVDTYKESNATIKLHKVSNKIPIQKGVLSCSQLFKKFF